jgi:glycosyltransferase involved in cell wall biosynthesis
MAGAEPIHGPVSAAPGARGTKRLAVFCDFSYRTDGDVVTGQFSFSLFLTALAPYFRSLTLIGRLDPTGTRFPYVLHDVEFEPLPYYASGADLGAVMRALPAAVRRFWSLLDRVDVVWVLGPNPPHAIAFALLALVRRRRLVLGVRQQLPRLIRHRHPGRPHVWLAAWVLEHAFRLLGRVAGVVVVGPELAREYRHSRSVHTTLVSLLADDDVADASGDDRDYAGAVLRLLSVGRLDPEKNPLLMLDILRAALATDPRWRLEVCGDGTLAEAIEARAAALGVADRLVMHGHVAFGGGLWDLYRSCHALLHVSMTEGMPQVLLEAFAARLPVVATAVGGVPEMTRGRGLLIPPRDAAAGAAALDRLLSDPAERARHLDAATSFAHAHTLQAESARVAAFLEGTS